MARMNLDDTAMRQVEMSLASAPEAHQVIKCLRGVRKARFALSGRGKSGGGRLFYCVAVKSAIDMMAAHPKNERNDLSNDQRKAILAFIEGLIGN
jgi:hypothetical protein